MSETRTCTHCGRELPVSEFYASKRYICKECFRAQSKVWREANIERVRAVKNAYNHKIRGNPVRTRSLKEIPLPAERQPIPALEVGKAYKITDNGRTWQGVAGGDGNSKPVHFVGPCIGRYGVNWALRTSTGIRTFTSGQLVGLTVKEVA